MNKQRKKPAATPTVTNRTAPSVLPLAVRIRQWIMANPKKILTGLIVLWIAGRIALFDAMVSSNLYQMYRWEESDNAFFDEQARAIADGDWLNTRVQHPYHGWHQSFADYHFRQRPDERSRMVSTRTGGDTSAVAVGKALWNEWYGGPRYHQEPLYTYLLALLYRLTGNGVYWMMVLQSLIGVGSGVLLWALARRYFDDSTALLTGLLYAFCGIAVFHEFILLRTSLGVFFTLLAVWSIQQALDRTDNRAFMVCGLCIGAACLLQSYFILFLPVAALLYYRQHSDAVPVALRHIALMAGGIALTFLPVLCRNLAAGAPALSSSSVGPVTFAVTNVARTKSVSGWQPEAAKCVPIMEAGHHSLAATAAATLGTHNVGSYLGLLGLKITALLNGAEWPNNQNYAFYRESIQIALQISYLRNELIVHFVERD